MSIVYWSVLLLGIWYASRILRLLEAGAWSIERIAHKVEDLEHYLWVLEGACTDGESDDEEDGEEEDGIGPSEDEDEGGTSKERDYKPGNGLG